MRIAVGLLAAALAGSEGPPAPAPEAGVVSFQVRVLEMDGLGWRESIYLRLTPVGRQGTAAVWTTSRGIARSLAKQADRVVTAPRVLARPGVTAVLDTMTRRRYVAHLARRADGPVNAATAVAFQPETQELREGLRASLTGQVEGRGVRVRVSLDDTQVVSVHEVKLTEYVRDEDGVESYHRPALEVPEVVASQVGGEWLVPRDGALVVSLGAQTVADDASEAASVRERLVIVEPELHAAPPSAGTASAAAPTRTVSVPVMPLTVLAPVPHLVIEWSPAARGSFTPAPPPPAAPPASRPMPPTPARSLPPAFDPDGSPASLPPLPDDELTPVSSEDASAEPRPSPQTRPIPARPKFDDPPAGPEGAPTDPKTGGTTSASRDSRRRPKDSDADVVKANLVDRPRPDCCAAAAADACPAETRLTDDSITIRIGLRDGRPIEIRTPRPPRP